MNNNEVKKMILKMFDSIDETDDKFLNQLYTIIKRHLEKKRRH